MRTLRLALAIIVTAALLLASIALQAPSAEGRRPDFARVDRHALAAPASAASSPEALAAYLGRAAQCDEEKARAIFTWLTHRIAYDTELPSLYRTPDVSPGEVLKRRRTNCEGYARLFEAVGKLAGLRCATIRGYVKGWSGTGRWQRARLTYHSWNAVHAGGAWRLLDCTLGAGYVDGEGEFARDCEDFFFFTPPSEFAYSHLPDAPGWQLLSKPVSRSRFELLPHPRPVFFEYGMELASHRTYFIWAQDSVEVALDAPERISLAASLEVSGSDAPCPSSTFVQRLGSQYRVHVVFPKPGSYTLKLLVKEKCVAEQYRTALEYAIEAKKGARESTPFPVVFTTFSERQVYLASPLQRRLAPGSTQRFRLRVPHAREVAVVIAGEFRHLRKSGDEFEGVVTIPRDADVLSVCAAFRTEEKTDMLLMYYVGGK